MRYIQWKQLRDDMLSSCVKPCSQYVARTSDVINFDCCNVIFGRIELVTVNRNRFYCERQTTTLRDFLRLFHVFLKCRRSSVMLRHRSLRHIVNQALLYLHS